MAARVKRSAALAPVSPSAVETDDAETRRRVAALTPAERLDLGVSLSRTAGELRRAAWEAQRGRSASA